LIRLWLVVLVAWLAQNARASDDAYEEWERLHEALLIESVDGDLLGAMRMYESLERRLRPDGQNHQILARALYRLGRANYELGDFQNAALKLRDCIRISQDIACKMLITEIALAEDAVRSLPVRWDFRNRQHGFVLIPGHGAMSVQTEEADSHLLWALHSTLGEADKLVLAFLNPKSTPQSMRMAAQTTRSPALLQIVLVDVYGHEYQPAEGVIKLSQEQRVYDISLSDIVSTTDSKRPNQPIDIDRLELRDISSILGGAAQPNRIKLQWFEVR